MTMKASRAISWRISAERNHSTSMIVPVSFSLASPSTTSPNTHSLPLAQSVTKYAPGAE